MQIALKIIERWCERMNLSVNPNKTTLVMFTKNRPDSTKYQRLRLFGEELSYSSTVKYLGLIFDAKLLWNEHLDSVVKKAKNSLWTCRKMVGKLWGLKPKLAHWVYTAMVRPIVSYAAIAWWQKTEEKTTQSKLEKLQRLACVTTLAAPKSAPTKALELLLDLVPLHIHLQHEAMSANCRFRISGKTEVNDIVDEILMNKLDNNEEMEFALSFTDYIDKEYNFDIPYSVTIPEKDSYNYEEELMGEETINCFTDGSLTENGTGSGIFFLNEDKRVSIPLDKHATVFQAECHAILECARTLIDKGLQNRVINIHSDSQAALKAINKNLILSKTVKNTIQALKELSLKNTVNLKWIPSHNGHEGNEVADEYARQAANTTNRQGNPVIGVPKNKITSFIKEHFKEKSRQEWNNKAGMQHAKQFIKDYDLKRKNEILNLTRSQTYTATGLLTGHYPLRYRLCIFRVSDDSSCRFCNEEEETVKHIMCECVGLDARRLKFFGQTNPRPIDIRKLQVKTLIRYFDSLDIR